MNDFKLIDNIYVYETNDDYKIAINSNIGGKSTNEYKSLNLALHVGDDKNNVLENRKIYSNKLNINFSNNIYMQQTHSKNVCEVNSSNIGNGLYNFDEGINDTDGIYTTDDSLVLNAMCADCTPVYFYSTEKNLFGVIHAGWQGTLKQVTYYTIKDAIYKHNLDPQKIKVIIGPSISIQSFEVDKDVYDMFEKQNLLNDNNHYKNGEKYHIDIKKINKEQCLKLNINDIFVSNIDTYTTDNLYSFRRNNITGRMCATIFKNKK